MNNFLTGIDGGVDGRGSMGVGVVAGVVLTCLGTYAEFTLVSIFQTCWVLICVLGIILLTSQFCEFLLLFQVNCDIMLKR